MNTLDRYLIVAAAGMILLLPAATHAAQQSQTAQHAGEYTPADIQSGSVVYALQCSQCHGPTGDQVGGTDLRSGRFRSNVTSDDDLRRIITNGIPGTSMPGRKLDPAQLHAVVAYVRNMRDFNATVVALGDVGRGRALFDGSGCQNCHRVGATGSRIASDLSDIGSSRNAAAIQQSLLAPDSTMMPINRPVRLVTKDGRTINGRRLNEDTFTIQLMTDQEQLMTVEKSALKEFRILTSSAMPSYKDKLSPQQLADVVAYLASLRGAGRGTGAGGAGRQGGPPSGGGAPQPGGRQGQPPGR
jgi:putative heme-binding domain-containing protein